ncbi:CAP domain-containing protein [Pseudonocardia nantongensis]|uniref:CAP domain-containing protein n=1 Tax=Pseudonocardia nantongensis TaxID=1181885 RepID=UPI00397B3DE8
MIRRRTPRPARTVLGGVGAGAALALAAPLAAPLVAPQGPSGPGGAVEETLPLRAVGAASAVPGTDGPADPGSPATAPPPALTASGAAGAAFDRASGAAGAVSGAAGAAFTRVPADPGFPAAAALAALDEHRAAQAVRAAAPDVERGPGDPPVRAAPARAAAPGGGLTGRLAQVVDLTNAERARAGCGALSVDPRISAAAQGHSEDMAARGYFAHDSPDGRDFADRITAAGYSSPGAENIAQGQPDAATVVQDWMESPGHRRNILDCSLSTIGVGLADGYWTQNFGR